MTQPRRLHGEPVPLTYALSGRVIQRSPPIVCRALSSILYRHAA